MRYEPAPFARCVRSAGTIASLLVRTPESGAASYSPERTRARRMIPKSFSASALQVAQTCMARYKAENVDRAARPANAAADLGTAVHAALEWYVKAVYIDKTKPASLQALLMLYRMQFMVIFDTVDPEAHDWYAEGADMLKVWFARTDFSNRRGTLLRDQDQLRDPHVGGKDSVQLHLGSVRRAAGPAQRIRGGRLQDDSESTQSG
jgi:hypothetical protein